MYGETHAVDGALDITIGGTTQLARCYVRFDNRRISTALSRSLDTRLTTQ